MIKELGFLEYLLDKNDWDSQIFSVRVLARKNLHEAILKLKSVTPETLNELASKDSLAEEHQIQLKGMEKLIEHLKDN